ncbi:hypothetical protein K3495_g1632 [Podosphaera aphanis]|nr:hypothetical protein K3495_g1632 [Podosphaera aphanis]
MKPATAAISSGQATQGLSTASERRAVKSGFVAHDMNRRAAVARVVEKTQVARAMARAIATTSARHIDTHATTRSPACAACRRTWNHPCGGGEARGRPKTRGGCARASIGPVGVAESRRRTRSRRRMYRCARWERGDRSRHARSPRSRRASSHHKPLVRLSAVRAMRSTSTDNRNPTTITNHHEPDLYLYLSEGPELPMTRPRRPPTNAAVKPTYLLPNTAFPLRPKYT